MSPILIITILLGYFAVLVAISYITGKKTDNLTFFQANKSSKWYVVAFGMIGASLSGVTFISVPGWVATSQFSYMQMVLGYVVGYFVIIQFLLPLYYKLNLISIYSYLEQRFGFWAYKTGAAYFLLSRIIGAAFRLFLVAGVFQLAIFDHFDIPFWVSTLITIVLIWVYTFRSGMKTIVWTDTLQTFFMITAVVVTIFLIKSEMNWSFSEMVSEIDKSQYSQIFFWDWKGGNNFFKQFFAGAFISIVMTGLDQDMMQKNLTCKNLKDAQKNMWGLSISLVFVNIVFLSLGALLYIFANQNGIAIPDKADNLFPLLALNHLSPIVGIFFMLGLVAAAYSSADSALTALTTSFCIDFLGLNKKENGGSKQTRTYVHIAFSFILFLVILGFNLINDTSVISSLFKAAGYTYGPLLGMFAFGIFTKRKVADNYNIILICIISPLLCYLINNNSAEWFNGYKFGFELLILNGLTTFLGLFGISKSK